MKNTTIRLLVYLISIHLAILALIVFGVSLLIDYLPLPVRIGLVYGLLLVDLGLIGIFILLACCDGDIKPLKRWQVGFTALGAIMQSGVILVAFYTGLKFLIVQITPYGIGLFLVGAASVLWSIGRMEKESTSQYR